MDELAKQDKVQIKAWGFTDVPEAYLALPQ